MFILNEYDIDSAFRRFEHDEVLGPAVVTLDNLCRAVNRCSDGWCYWKAPCQASKRLQQLIFDATRDYHNGRKHSVTAKEVRAAYTPIKSFLTKHPQVHCTIVVP